MKTRLSDSSSVYLEERYQHGDAATGLPHATGINLAPTERWNFGANWELGTLVDAQTDAETKRKAGGARIGYGFDTAAVLERRRVPLRRDGAARRDVDGPDHVAVPEQLQATS